MSLKTILNKQTDFTGEFPAEYRFCLRPWRFNESARTVSGSCRLFRLWTQFYYRELVGYYGKSVEESEGR